MEIKNINSQIINWDNADTIEAKGETGVNKSKEHISGEIRIRLSEYSANYKSAEWCGKGHIIHCIEGEMTIRLKSGNNIKLIEGDSLVLAENDPHIALTGNIPAKIFIVD